MGVLCVFICVLVCMDFWYRFVVKDFKFIMLWLIVKFVFIFCRWVLLVLNLLMLILLVIFKVLSVDKFGFIFVGVFVVGVDDEDVVVFLVGVGCDFWVFVFKKVFKLILGLCKLKCIFGIFVRVIFVLLLKFRVLVVSLLSSILRWFCVKLKVICEFKFNFIGDCGNVVFFSLVCSFSVFKLILLIVWLIISDVEFCVLSFIFVVLFVMEKVKVLVLLNLKVLSFSLVELIWLFGLLKFVLRLMLCSVYCLKFVDRCILVLFCVVNFCWFLLFFVVKVVFV